MKFMRGLTALLLIAGAFLWYRMETVYQRFQDETFVEIPHGASSQTIAALLVQAGVVRSRWDFLAARLLARARVLQAGEYRFRQPATPLEVVNRLARGDVFYYELIVPEGRNMFEIGAAVEQLGLFPADQFVAAARDPALIRDLDPQAPTLEGYLFPNTYRLNRHTTPEKLCRMMTNRFRQVWRGLHTNADVHTTVTLASMVEREGKLAEERPVIAAVFQNRLRIGMKLDCDSTTIYAARLANAYRGAIYKSDLASFDPYNTYQHPGLPPGPIANPGLASLHAVLQPAATNALYFVLRPDGSGAHQFSRSITDHIAAAAKYHRALHR
jgi:UPF0755 protein